MDFTKIDFAKFDVTKLMDADAMLDQIEKNNQAALGYITDAKSREIAQTISTASIEFARAQAAAVKAYGEAVKKPCRPKNQIAVDNSIPPMLN